MDWPTALIAGALGFWLGAAWGIPRGMRKEKDYRASPPPEYPPGEDPTIW